MRLSQLVAKLGGELRGADADVTRVSSLEGAMPDALTFLTNPKFKNLLVECKAACVLLKAADAEDVTLPHIVTDNPYLYYARAAALLHPAPAVRAGIHPAAYVDATAVVAADAEVGPGATVCAGAVIGAGAVIMPQAYVGERAQVGAGARMYPQSCLMAECIIGERVILHPGAVIGADGFGNAWAGDHWEKIPQLGRAIIGDDVEIGANTTIDRGALEDTIVANGARIDNLIMIGHNCQIGEHTAMASCVGIAGSTRIGARCQIGGAAMIGGHLEIADGTIVLAATAVTKSIREPGVYGGPIPAAPQDQWARNAVHLRRLEVTNDKVKQLEKQVAALLARDAQEE
ncbi:UDP-3-O-(3-hydroxymyristoyl)glucosamine N-acyltransferase [Silvimonas iriomotensis]|uniref:UDP-3-O-acylglucosamine N-acyltransferase n=1 Tax=Silvimonas iriomotensis TaxID=449662 RepID=A0ABQ2P5Z9_9NEIS|nr:UDP-3-O-(3-hydroxymyristoyl)glucosamine N-acyltransferase [Silvimonas iriomotensis]GGP18754.1 UDP-3-O-acylglucosamine N-acyltransferase [Silvimonas iriomotensis]